MPEKYFEDSFLFDFDSELIEIIESEEGPALIFKDTIFYPQGGGQPSDRGSIASDFFNFEVHKVRKKENRILHFGKLKSGDLKLGSVHQKLDSNLRIQHTQIHSAGHILDVAMIRIGIDLLPTKGYHFPDSPYVEYQGVIEAEERSEVIEKLNRSLENLIKEDHFIEAQWVNGLNAVKELCPQVPSYLDFSQDIRIVTVADGIGCPCAGTHVKKTSEIKRIEVKKIKCKKGITRVSYTVSN
ncbi:MAG: alanine--tRNA ligase-related protein [Bacteroidota bacterium]